MTDITEVLEDFQDKYDNLVRMEESLAQRMLALDNIGWEKVSGVDDDFGPTLDNLHQTSQDLQDMAISSPFMKRGCQLRHAYVFGRGVDYGEPVPRVRKFMEDPYNRDAMFSVGAYETMNSALFTDGNFFMIRDKDNILTVVPLSQITGVVTDPNDSQKIQYLRRSWTRPSVDGSSSEVVNEWFPLSRYKKKVGGKAGLRKTITKQNQPVSQNSVMYHRAGFRLPGWTFGIPDSLAAKVMTIAYSKYLRNNAMLVEALAQFAWKITSATKTGTDRAAASVATSGVAGTAVMGEGNNLQAIPRSGSDVNFNNGQPLAAAVATALGVPVIALLSSPGAGSGSYGAATTLDEPTLKGMMAIQESWKDFQLEVLQDVAGPSSEKKITVEYPAISTDATYRQIASLALGHGAGAIFQDEFREQFTKLMDVTNLHGDSLPEPGFFNTWNDPTFIGQAVNAMTGGNSATSGQGKSGSVPGGTNQGDTDHSGDND